MKIRIQKTKIKRILAFILFLLLAWQIFSRLTYLFRNTGAGDRLNILAFQTEREDSLDMVYIGGSNVGEYWDPFLAWEKSGLTSYSYFTTAMAASPTIACIKEIYKAQSPRLIIVDVRKFLIWNDSIDVGFRNIVDALPLNVNRLESIIYHCKLNDISAKEMVESIFDLGLYHNNLDALGQECNWRMSDDDFGNFYIDRFNGYEYNWAWDANPYFGDYVFPKSKKCSDMLKSSERCFRDLLEFCNKSSIELLLTASPFIIQDQTLAEGLNEIARIAGEYNIPFLNCNLPETYSEIGLDFWTDFYDSYHVNVLGARKYTEFLTKYISENYQLPDHRSDADFSEWYDEYDAYSEIICNTIENVQNRANEKMQTLSSEEEMRNTSDAEQWLSLADDENLTLFIGGNELSQEQYSETSRIILQSFGVPFRQIKENDAFICVYSGGVQYSNATELSYSKDVITPAGMPDISYSVNMEKGVFSVDIKKDNSSKGDNFIRDVNHEIVIEVFDNNMLRTVDFVRICALDDGKLSLEHVDSLKDEY